MAGEGKRRGRRWGRVRDGEEDYTCVCTRKEYTIEGQRNRVTICACDRFRAKR